MSNRACLLALYKHETVVAEIKSAIPMAWLAFGECVLPDQETESGLKPFDRKEAMHRLSEKVAFYEGLFPELVGIKESAAALQGALKRLRCKSIAVDMFDLIDDLNRSLLTEAIAAVVDEDAERSFRIPSESVLNPYTEEVVERPERRFESTRELLMAACHVADADLKATPDNNPTDVLFGVLW